MSRVESGQLSEGTAPLGMGSVGSGVASQPELTMRSVGTRTTQSSLSCGPASLPPPAGRRRLEDRSYSAERPPAAPPKGLGYTAEGSYYGSNGERLVSNAAFMNGAGRRDGPRGPTHVLDICGNSVVLNNDKNDKSGHHKDTPATKLDNHNPPNILPVSGKLEQAMSSRGSAPCAEAYTHTQNNDGLVRPSAFKPVVPKSFHSMQNLVCAPQTGAAGGRSGGGGGAHPGPGAHGERDSSSDRGPHSLGGSREGQGGSLSDSGRNSLTSLPTYTGSGGYGPPPALGPLSASTSHINRLGTAALDKLDKPGYQNGLSASDSGRSSSGKSSSSYQRLSHLSDAPAPLRPSPSSDDIIQDLEDRLWEREQEVLHMRRNLDQSEAAIAQVFEEKQRAWEREMEELRQNYAVRLQQVSRRAQRTQQALQAQVTRLQQDKRRLQDEIAALLAQREELERKCLDYRKEQADILPQLEETKWEVCQKAGEISLLKQQLRDSQGEVTQRAGEMVALRGQLKEASAQLKEREEAILGLKESYSSKSLELERCDRELQKTLAEVSLLRDKLDLFEAEVLGLKQALGDMGSGRGEAGDSADVPPSVSDTLLDLQSDEAKAQRQEAGDLRRQLERLQGELRLERQQRERQALTFAQERHTWQGEKERVLKYQAQLQLSYVEMLQKNQALEERVDQLNTKLVVSPASPPPSLLPALPAPPTLSLSPPPGEETKLPALHQLAPPWPVATRLERIESTEI
ncbi:leucine zipper putative tumor suppressor 3 [Denticeps clupeoides]|uniref:Leucine zipper tumor suppressor 3 n=1 Tax=Denticeps clupeoides TaxID=299321 RepID=A0AAY4BHF4_9TELE|nr:leucine zipper putative tumor suppressor 3 [Denticeps clupeoides]XP_028828979.1 leucine zipper putative tumor suppressor 3 [Denticeps clupeoides]XP_028828980.1 leucine zipper putative tumor suppressor 3 [Denticeps clupeoides]XP_028828981.1 leucine zipper putative tumor suppressor 3 [Denticeps clupeoides]